MDNIKYLYSNGCSYTEGYGLDNPEKERYSKFLANKFTAEDINQSAGGGSNQRIFRTTYNWISQNQDKLKDTLFVIQLSECLRHLVHFDLIPNSYGDLTKEGRYYNITPGLFLGQGGFLTDDRPTGWDDAHC